MSLIAELALVAAARRPCVGERVWGRYAVAADRRGTVRFSNHRPLRRSRAVVPRLRERMAGCRALHRVRPHAGRPADAGAGGFARPRAHARRCARTQGSGDADPGRHPRRRDRRQGCGLPRPARDAGRQGGRRARSTSVVLLFVPVFNVDGHERFGRWNRPNQHGPEEMGWRTTAQNLNLNRDYMKADAPEMQAMLRLVERMGSGAVRGPARHRWRAVPARRLDHRRADASRAMTQLQRGRPRAARRADRAAAPRRARCRWPSIPRSSKTTTRPRASPWRRSAAFFHRLFAAAQPLRHAGRNAFVEGLPDPRAGHPQRHRRRCSTWSAKHGTQLAAPPRAPPTRARRNSAARAVPLDYQATAHVSTDRFPRLCLHARALGRFRRAR